MLGFEDHLKKMNLRCPLQRCTATFLNSNMLKRHILNLHISYLVQFVKDRGIQAIKVCFFIQFTSLKFIHSEKATKFCEIFPLLLTVCTVVKSKGNISQNFLAFSEYLNFKGLSFL